MRRIENLADTPAEKSLGEDEFKRQLLASGLMTSFLLARDTAPRPEFQPAAIEGEPISETIIRERR